MTSRFGSRRPIERAALAMILGDGGQTRCRRGEFSMHSGFRQVHIAVAPLFSASIQSQPQAHSFEQNGGHMNFAKPMIFTGMVLAAGLAHSQSAITVGYLLDQGGKKLSSDEIKSLLSGARTSYPTGGNGESTVAFRPDGSIQAHWANPDTRTTGNGTWKLEGNDKYCITLNWSASFMRSGSFCFHIFKVGEKFFIATSETDRNVAAFERVYER